jgi:hypothetical protein
MLENSGSRNADLPELTSQSEGRASSVEPEPKPEHIRVTITTLPWS